ncbi:MAG: glycosyltransferase family 4 protein [Actinomycetota bacterium]|nr:glycosyltransferase family 4 protein [Actinomycetota bacterium]
MRILFVLPGMHRVHRGAEVAIGSVANEIASAGKDEVVVAGSGPEDDSVSYQYRKSHLIRREKFERWPTFPVMRSEYVWEEASFAAGFLPHYRPRNFDVTVTCSYPFVNWILARWPPIGRRPPHIYVTQNGDWPPSSDDKEYRWFRCDGLVCTNPDYYERNRVRWPSALIPNGFDPARFHPGEGSRERFELPGDVLIVLMVSALVPSKRVLEGMEAVAKIPNAFLVAAGDGPLRSDVDAYAEAVLPGRFRRLTLPASEMPYLYRTADVFLHPTLYESFGNVYVEALATGIPIVVHDYSVTRWIFGDHHPGLVDTTDIGAVTAALRDATIRGRDDPARSTDAAARFAWSRVAEGYRSFLADVVEGRVGDPHS